MSEIQGNAVDMITSILHMRGWKNKDLAKRLNVNTTTVWRWKTGKMRVNGPSYILIEQEMKKTMKRASK